jgi:hypothetical protein
MARRKRVRHISTRKVTLKDLVSARRALTAALLRHEQFADKMIFSGQRSEREGCQSLSVEVSSLSGVHFKLSTLSSYHLIIFLYSILKVTVLNQLVKYVFAVLSRSHCHHH